MTSKIEAAVKRADLGLEFRPGVSSLTSVPKPCDHALVKRSLLLAAACVLPLAFGQAPLKKMTAWVDPVKDEPSGSHYKIFHSKLANTDWSYLVYLPPDYETSPQTRYPAIYWLHGGGGTQRQGTAIAQRLDSAIRRGKAPAAIVFMLNGLGESCWSDSKDGAQPVESMIVQELIPYFDRTYRTIPRREARAIEGHSMGGMGALHLGVRHSDQFGVVSGLAAALISEKDEPMKVPPVAFEKVYGSDPAYFRENTVWTDTERNAGKLRSGILIRIVVGDKDAWVYQRLQDYHALLNRLQVPHEFIVVPGAQHPAIPLYDWLGDRAFDIYNKAFGSLKP
jgi:enterochelin esterase-like enzyme